MKKRLLVILFTFLMIGIISFGDRKNIHAEEGVTYTEGTLYYVVEDESITITGCFGKDEVVEIPSQIAGTPVNTIKEGAFIDNAYIKKVILPDTITTIENNSFGPAIEVVQKTAETNDTETGEDEKENSEEGIDNNDSAAKEDDKEQSNDTDQSETTTSTEQLHSNDSSSDNNVVIQKGDSDKENIEVSTEEENIDEIDVNLEEETEEAITEETKEEDVITTEETVSDSSFPVVPLAVVAVGLMVLIVFLINKRKRNK